MSGALTSIGSYQGSAAGRGGFATVYRVTLPSGAPAALKWIDNGAEPSAVSSLYHEHDVLSELLHPQIPTLYDLGLTENRPFLVIDWVDGESLDEEMPGNNGEGFAELLRELTCVLWFVHQRGWVHGDIKPDNLRWSEVSTARDAASGLRRLCLLDFGLARPLGDASRPVGAGTVGYCAPEFLNRVPADGRADWYSVGVVLYEWIFGVRPFADADPAVEVAGHLESPPDLSRPIQRSVPEWALQVVTRLLAKDPDDRGESEWSLLDWLSQFDHDLAPYRLRNRDVAWHCRSEDHRLDITERSLVHSVCEAVRSDSVGCGIGTHFDFPHRIMRPIISELTRSGWALDLHNCTGVHPSQKDLSDDVVLSVCQSNADQSNAKELRWSPRPVYANVSVPASRATRYDVNCLPWDKPRVETYLFNVVGDMAFAERWSSDVLRVTGGIPSLVSSMMQTLHADQHLNVNDNGVEINEERLLAWTVDSKNAECFELISGTSDDHQDRLVDWVALGRSYGNANVIQALLSIQDGDFEQSVRVMVLRGVLIDDRKPGSEERFDLRLRLPGFDLVSLSRMNDEQRAHDAFRLAKVIEDGAFAPDIIRCRMLSDCFADARQWEKASRYATDTAMLELESDNDHEALRRIDAAETAAERITDPTVRAHCWGRARMVYGDYLKASGRIEEAHRVYRELLRIGRTHKDAELLAETLKDLGDLYRITRRFDKGVRALRIARRLWDQLRDLAEVSRTLNNLGNMYWVASDLVNARQHYQEALSIQRALGLDAVAATTSSNLGALHLVGYEYDEAQRAFREALAIHAHSGNLSEKAGMLNNLGAIEFMRGKLDQAQELFHDAAAINEREGARGGAVLNHRNIVEVSLERGDLRRVVSMGTDVYNEALELGDTATGADVGAILAEAYLRAGDFRKAREQLQIVRQLAAELKNDDLLGHVALVEASYHRRLGNMEHALEILENAFPLNQESVNRHLGVDATILRLGVAVQDHGANDIAALWAKGQGEAEIIGAPHKAALLAFAKLSGHFQTSPLDDQIVEQIIQFLKNAPDWHWTGEFALWQSMCRWAADDKESARHFADSAVSQLRRDGNFEALWRALAARGQLAFEEFDFETAIQALTEAARILEAIVKTIDNETGWISYLNQESALRLAETRKKLSSLVS